MRPGGPDGAPGGSATTGASNPIQPVPPHPGRAPDNTSERKTHVDNR